MAADRKEETPLDVVCGLVFDQKDRLLICRRMKGNLKAIGNFPVERGKTNRQKKRSNVNCWKNWTWKLPLKTTSWIQSMHIREDPFD